MISPIRPLTAHELKFIAITLNNGRWPGALYNLSAIAATGRSTVSGWFADPDAVRPATVRFLRALYWSYVVSDDSERARSYHQTLNDTLEPIPTPPFLESHFSKTMFD